MPPQPSNRPLGAFLKALAAEKIDCILIGMMAAIEQGAPLMTIDYDFWVDLPERQYVRLLVIVKAQGGAILAPTLYELRDGPRLMPSSNRPGCDPLSRNTIIVAGAVCRDNRCASFPSDGSSPTSVQPTAKKTV